MTRMGSVADVRCSNAALAASVIYWSLPVTALGWFRGFWPASEVLALLVGRLIRLWMATYCGCMGVSLYALERANGDFR